MGRALPETMPHDPMDKLDWREMLSWRVGVRRALAGNAYRCPWWANEAFYRLAYRMVYCVDIPDPVGVRRCDKDSV